MKKIALNLKIAWRSLCSFKIRTSLAVLGVFLGTFSLIVVTNLSGSMSKKTETEIAALGESLLIVQSGAARRVGTGTRLMTDAATLTVADAEAIAQKLLFVNNTSPSANRLFPVRYGNTTLRSVLLVGAAPNYSEVRNHMVQRGSFITNYDNINLNRVAVIGQRVAENLFGDEDPIGKYILIFRVPCKVVGVMEKKGADIAGFDRDNQIFIPLNTYMRRFVNKDFINTIYANVASREVIDETKSQIEELLRKRHNIRPGQRDNFTVINPKDVMALREQTTSMITVLGRIASAVSFIIGGIGILSIMILIVNERRVEIGIRRAVGAGKRDIVFQFLMESSFISFSGGMVGVMAGFIASAVIFRVSDLPFVISPVGIAVAFLASVTVGVLAGLYPSKKAISMQPADVIRL